MPSNFSTKIFKSVALRSEECVFPHPRTRRMNKKYPRKACIPFFPAFIFYVLTFFFLFQSFYTIVSRSAPLETQLLYLNVLYLGASLFCLDTIPLHAEVSRKCKKGRTESTYRQHRGNI